MADRPPLTTECARLRKKPGQSRVLSRRAIKNLDEPGPLIGRQRELRPVCKDSFGLEDGCIYHEVGQRPVGHLGSVTNEIVGA